MEEGDGVWDSFYSSLLGCHASTEWVASLESTSWEDARGLSVLSLLLDSKSEGVALETRW